MKKRIKIFAAFDKDAEEDVVRFGDFICGLNATHHGVDFTVFKSEKALCESLEHPQKKIDGELGACEYFLLILGGKNDDFALDKLNQAIERYRETKGNPDIHIFVNTKKKGADDVVKYFASEEYEHYVERFDHYDTLKTKFLIWFSAKQKDFTYEVGTVKDIDGNDIPVITVGGKPVSGLLKFDALINNEDYQDDLNKLNRKREEREEYRIEMLNAKDEERDDLWDDISALAKEIDELQEKITNREKDTIALYKNYAKMTLENGYNEKLNRARECVEQGRLDRARKVLDPEGSINNLKAIANENEVLAERIEANKKIAEQEINILFAEIDRLKLDTGNKNRFEEIEKNYANIEYFQEKLGMEVTVLFAYANFLAEQNNHEAAIEKYTQELIRWRKLAETNPDEYSPYVATVLGNLANSQATTKHYPEYPNNAKANYTEALNIWQKLAVAEPGIYLPNVAQTLHNLASLQDDNKDYENAEKNYIEARDIQRTFAIINPSVYLPSVATTQNSLAVLQLKTKRYNEAKINITDALKIRRELAATNHDMYLRYVADTLCNMATLQRNMGPDHYDEAKTNYTEALKIQQDLAETNPSVYLPNVASTLYNLAILQKDMGPAHYSEAETNYTQALKIRQDLAETNHRYLPDVAKTLNNLAHLQILAEHYPEAETNYKKVLKTRQDLAETNPIYLPDVAKTLNNLAYSQKNMGLDHYDEAETNYTEALEIYEKLAETNPKEYKQYAVMMTINLVDILKRQINHSTEEE